MKYNRAIFSVVMVGATFMILCGALPAQGGKPDTSTDWCYVSAAPEDRFVCFSNRELCNKAQSSDVFASTSCYRNPLVEKI